MDFNRFISIEICFVTTQNLPTPTSLSKVVWLQYPRIPNLKESIDLRVKSNEWNAKILLFTIWQFKLQFLWLAKWFFQLYKKGNWAFPCIRFPPLSQQTWLENSNFGNIQPWKPSSFIIEYKNSLLLHKLYNKNTVENEWISLNLQHQ